jgi:hypothetical protein
VQDVNISGSRPFGRDDKGVVAETSIAVSGNSAAAAFLEPVLGDD